MFPRKPAFVPMPEPNPTAPLDVQIRAHGAFLLESILSIIRFGAEDPQQLAACELLLAYGWGRPRAASVGALESSLPNLPQVKWDKMSKREIQAVQTLMEFDQKLKDEGGDNGVG